MMSSLARIVSDVCILAEQLTTYIVGLEQCFSAELGEGYFTPGEQQRANVWRHVKGGGAHRSQMESCYWHPVGEVRDPTKYPVMHRAAHPQ